MNRKNTSLLAFVLAAFSTAPAVRATVFEVTKTADAYDGGCNDDCSLRDAVRAANANLGDDAILLGPGVYTLTREGAFEDSGSTGDLDVSDGLILLGQGAPVTILDGGGIDRVLQVLGGARLEIHGVTIRNGHARIWPSPVRIPGTGGGIAGSVILEDCLVTGNVADDSGGGLDGFDVTIRNSTISGNSANVDGGGLEAVIAHLENVTVSGNHATETGGGLMTYPEDQVFLNVTVTGNSAFRSGGIHLSDIACAGGCNTTFRMARSVVAGNTAAQNPDCGGLPTSNGGNVFGVADGCGADAYDRHGSLQAPLDPRLSPLGDHGGPTPTHLPLPGSPALDYAGGCSATDQRGAPRPAQCDSGAVKASSACLPGAANLCLQGGRFRVTATWKTAAAEGDAQSVPLTSDTGAFWFFNPTNLELTLKVLDGCAVNSRYWVFVTGLTDVQVDVRVEDTLTGESWTHTHPAGTAFQPRLDTGAFACP
jgi:CSLREA domain-containing protein